jgi:EAL domain-containing protein (putative c-di-GMP-specific phosphodiesterase class I)/CheY-like chemotaxis protein
MHASPHLLVIDDDPALSALIAHVATQEGYRCTLAADLPLGTTVRGTDITLILLDLMMPTPDGIEWLRGLAQQEYPGHLVLMSGVDPRVLATAVDLATTLGLQVLQALVKPIPMEVLQVVLRHHLAAGPPAPGPRSPAPAPITAGDLQQAIAEKHLFLHYQPQLACTTGLVVGVEALVRWLHPVRGLVWPDAFIGQAESLGLVTAVDRYVMECGLREWGALDAIRAPLTLSLNVSAHTLRDLDLPDRLLALTRQTDITPAHVVVELTESALVRDFATALDVLTRLRLRAFQVSIDDFGMGYAMLEQLRRVPATELKIDRSFVQAAATDARARTIVHKTIELGHALGMRVVAEGVETPQQLAMLQAYACDVVQGYLFSRPLRMADVAAWLRQPRFPL